MSEKVNHVKDELTTKFKDALDRTKVEVDNVAAKLKEFDDNQKITETVGKQTEKASEFFQSSLGQVKESLAGVTEAAEGIFDKTKENSVQVFGQAVAKVHEAVDAISARAKEYDEKYQISNKVAEIVNPIKDKIKQILDEVFAQFKSFNDALNVKVQAALQNTKEYLLSSAASLDNKYDIENKVTKQLDKLGEAAKSIDGKWKVTELLEKAYEKGKAIDEKVTAGKAGNFVEEKVTTGVKFVSEQVEVLYKDFDTVKRSSRENLAQVAN